MVLQNQFRKSFKNHKRMRTIIYIFKHNGKTKVHNKRLDHWLRDWPSNRAWNLVKKNLKTRFYSQFQKGDQERPKKKNSKNHFIRKSF